jgi:hypothetical protein
MGHVFGLSDAILGVTVFALGNSTADLVANYTIARMGYPVMAISACYGGPLLNMLLGVGISGSYFIAKSGQPYYIDFDVTLITTCSALLVLLSAHLLGSEEVADGSQSLPSSSYPTTDTSCLGNGASVSLPTRSLTVKVDRTCSLDRLLPLPRHAKRRDRSEAGEDAQAPQLAHWLRHLYIYVTHELERKQTAKAIERQVQRDMLCMRIQE